jgi:hypothetical protein
MRSGRCAVMYARSPVAGFVQARLGRAGDLAGRLVGVVEERDGLALAGGKVRDRAAQRVGAVEVLG